MFLDVGWFSGKGVLVHAGFQVSESGRLGHEKTPTLQTKIEEVGIPFISVSICNDCG